MAYILQHRSLRKRIEQQLKQVKDEESTPTSDRRNLNEETPEDSERERGDDPEKANFDPYENIDGISRSIDSGSVVYIVGWENEHDPANPRNWSTRSGVRVVFQLILVSFVATGASSIDSAVTTEAAKEFGVSKVTESLATGLYLIGFGIGCLLASPLSELLGRYPVYLGTLCIFGAWLLGAALAPNIGAQLTFRFLAGLCSSAPLTVAGGSISDLFTPLEKTWAFPLFAIAGFGAPVLAPVIGAYIGYSPHITWRWTEWLMLIIDGAVIATLIAFMRETFGPRILQYKAQVFRKATGDDRFKSPSEVAGGKHLGDVLKKNFTRPFILCMEPIVMAFTLYLSIVYIILFTFFDGYTFIFARTYGINEGLSFIVFVGLLSGILSSMALVPWVYKRTKQQLERDGDDGSGRKLDRESRLLFAMVGAPLLPIGLFWMAWTSYPSISIWSPILAQLPIGFSFVSIFMSAYMYIIDSYEVYAASALTFVALVRYIAAGGMTVVGFPMYENLNHHWTLTLLGCLSVLVTPLTFVLYRWGPNVRARSKFAVGHVH